MRKVLILDGVSLPGATGKPAIVLTPEDRAMAHIPGWRFFYDPEYIVEGAPRNMALPDNVSAPINSPLSTAAFPNGAPGFDISEARPFQPNISFPQTNWTVFGVFRLQTAPNAQEVVGPIGGPVPEGEIAPAMGFSAGAGNIAIRTGEGPSAENRLTYTTGGTYVDLTRLFMWTGSTRDGVRIYENGVEVAADANETSPITSRYNAGEWRLLQGVRGLVGNFGLLDIDLGWEEHAGYRRSIERFLMDKYGIS